jgi:hypothetical protein
MIDSTVDRALEAGLQLVATSKVKAVLDHRLDLGPENHPVVLVMSTLRDQDSGPILQRLVSTLAYTWSHRVAGFNARAAAAAA